MERPASQRGVAIIGALLIAAVVAVIAGQILARQSLLTRVVENEQRREQGRWLLLGGVELSRQVLWEARKDHLLTHPSQSWALPIKEGAFEGHIEDELGKFNLNNLMQNGATDQAQNERFERLCRLINVNSRLCRRIATRVAAAYPRRLLPLEHVAKTSARFNSGRQTSPGAQRELAAERPMLRDLDDLRGLKGMDDQVMARLARHVTVLPANTWINCNTASAQVLAASVPGLSLERAQGLTRQRDKGQWFLNFGDFVNRLNQPQLSLESIPVVVSSDWFRLYGQVLQGSQRVHVQALLYGNEDRQPQVIWSRVGA
ncbi:type II secretion system minor pseudopilin GspK [Pseudomonas sp. ITA]|uniref:type II secretion system minor pseudopilin GspK n=1 Tax=Pseudomonas sp. ITA TaxID=2825841 RepID=UPI002497D85D|nr:type II secretion system minor pseudopilin GspK [Pseudomonas sp. ITA]MDI2146183.1 type II secretion system minor pseudopilin GspK [Pseudomonas sp. ITA]